MISSSVLFLVVAIIHHHTLGISASSAKPETNHPVQPEVKLSNFAKDKSVNQDQSPRAELNHAPANVSSLAIEERVDQLALAVTELKRIFLYLLIFLVVSN